MKKMLKWAAILAVVALVVGTFVYLYIKSRPQEVVYELNEVQIKDLEKTTIVTGKIEPRDEVNIKPQISGIITELYKEAGEMVKKEVRVKVLVPEHQEQEYRVEITYPEIIFAVASCEEHTGKTYYGCKQVYEEDRCVPAYSE